MSYKFVQPVDQSLYDKSAAAWRKQATEDPENINESHYEGVLNHCGDALNGKTFGGGSGSLCAVIDEETENAAAFIICTYAVDKHVKMLNVYVEPILNAANVEPNVPSLAWIAACAIIGCLELTYAQYPCNELKVLASWPLDKEFLTAITTAMMGNKNFGPLFNVSYHGNWIVLTKR